MALLALVPGVTGFLAIFLGLADCDGYEFQIVSLDNKIWHFEAASVEEREEWVTAIEHQILSSLQGNESSKSKSRMNSLVDAASIQSLRSTVIGNSHCADCDAPSKSRPVMTSHDVKMTLEWHSKIGSAKRPVSK